MKPVKSRGHQPQKSIALLARAFVVAGFLFALSTFQAVGMAPGPGGTNYSPTYIPLNAWSFHDSTNWTSDRGYAPVAFTNLAFSYLGNGSSLVVDSPDQALLQFNVLESNGATNLTLNSGSVTLWFAPGSWAGTNMGGTGPGFLARLLEVGSYTTNSSFGLWSLYVDEAGTNLFFSTQTNDLSSTVTTYVSAPIAWATNYFHHLALTYSATNTALYMDGALAASGPALTVYPGTDVSAGGFYIGSDSNGLNQAHGLFNRIITYKETLDADTIHAMFQSEYPFYQMNPANRAMMALTSGNSSPSTGATPNVVTGQGNLQDLGATSVCVDGTNANHIWFTNVTATTASDSTMTVTFAIEGGLPNSFYDVFAGTGLTSPLGNSYWAWQGQGPRCRVYSLTGLPQGTVFLILGAPKDTDGDGLTDAYENLVSHTDPNNAYSNLDGILDGWVILLGLNPQTSNFTSDATRLNYLYTPADWLNTISGLKTSSVELDDEGNIKKVSQ